MPDAATHNAEISRLSALIAEMENEGLQILQGNTSTLVHGDSGSLWQVRDILTHLIGWKEEGNAALEAFAQGKEYLTEGSVDEYNERNYQKRKDYTEEELAKNWVDACTKMRSLSEKLPLAKWSAEMLYPWGEKGSVSNLIEDLAGHERMHLRQVTLAREKA